LPPPNPNAVDVASSTSRRHPGLNVAAHATPGLLKKKKKKKNPKCQNYELVPQPLYGSCWLTPIYMTWFQYDIKNAMIDTSKKKKKVGF